MSSGPGGIHCGSLLLYPSHQRYFITVLLNTLSLKGWQHNTAIMTRCAVRREERIPTSNLQHLAKNDSKSAHVWTRQNVVVSTRYNVASVAAGNLTTKKYTLRGYFQHFYYYFYFFDGTAIRGYSQKIRGYSLECSNAVASNGFFNLIGSHTGN